MPPDIVMCMAIAVAIINSIFTVAIATFVAATARRAACRLREGRAKQCGLTVRIVGWIHGKDGKTANGSRAFCCLLA